MPLPTTPLAPPPESSDLGINLKAAPLESTDLRFPINLATALRLSDARPLIVAAAQAGVWVAEAQLTRAKVLWVPTLNIGADYIRHDGGGPDFNKGIMTAPSVNFFYGGAGMIQNVALTDVIFQPLAQRQVLNSRQWNIQSAKNDALMMTADAYFQVHQYRGMYAGALYCVERGHDLVLRIATLSKELVPTVEVERPRTWSPTLSSKRPRRVRSGASTAPTSPRSSGSTPRGGRPAGARSPSDHPDRPCPAARRPDPDRPHQSTRARRAPGTRPGGAMRIRREKGRMLLPSILLNGFQTPYEEIQAGIFGIGPNSKLNQWDGRDDFSVQALWQLDAFGIGNLARIKEQRGEQSKEIINLFMTQDRVAGDVTRAQVRVQSATARVSQADRALRTAILTFNGNFEGLQQTKRFGDVLELINRPQEVVFALQLLKLAFDEYFATVADYNRAQFEMFHALGYPATEVANLRPPGDILPVETARPPYLPPVGNGPPPATR